MVEGGARRVQVCRLCHTASRPGKPPQDILQKQSLGSNPTQQLSLGREVATLLQDIEPLSDPLGAAQGSSMSVPCDSAPSPAGCIICTSSWLKPRACQQDFLEEAMPLGYQMAEAVLG